MKIGRRVPVSLSGAGRVPRSTYASGQVPSRRSSSLFWTTTGTSEQQTVGFPLHPPGSGDAEISATDEQPSTETASLESIGRNSEASWWLLPVVVLGVCAGLVLLAVAALGTTYTYKIVVSRIGVDGTMTYPTGPDGEAMVLLPGDSEEDGDDEEGERGSDDGGPPRSAARLWCFVRSLRGVAPAARGTPAASPLPRGLCSAVVYQGIQVTWHDSQASLVTSSLAASGDLERLASLRDFEPLLELHVHAVSANVTKGSTGGSGRRPSAALRSLLRAPQGTVEGFAMRSARWLADRHVNGLVLELGRSVQALPTELITRLAELCHRQLGRVGKSFTLLLPGSTSLFVQYDLDALLTTRGLHPILRTDADGARPVATCPSPLNAPDFGIVSELPSPVM
ncbi:hypothetical protein ISCGN_030903 [Ixodes scapularis]